MANTEYIGVKDIVDPFVLVENVNGVGYGELVHVRDSKGKLRFGQVKMLSEKATLVQVFTGTEDLVPSTTKIRFLGRPLEVKLSKNMLGRTFNGLGEPKRRMRRDLRWQTCQYQRSTAQSMARQYPAGFHKHGHIGYRYAYHAHQGAETPHILR